MSANDLYFDRTVSDELVSALEPNGFAHSMVEYATRGGIGMDLALRRDPGKSTRRSWATLYAGTTHVLTITHSTKGFRLDVAERWQHGTGWQASWQNWQVSDRLSTEWSDVDTYVDAAIKMVREAGHRHMGEGTLQAAVARNDSNGITVVDRESRLGFQTRLARDEQTNHWYSEMPRVAKTGGRKTVALECDLLGIADDGRLLAMEIKPLPVAVGVESAAQQAWCYATQFQAWADQDYGLARAVINKMVRQRTEIGLASKCDLHVSPNDPLLVTPVLAIEQPAAGNLPTEQLDSLQTAMPDLEVYGIAQGGTLVRYRSRQQRITDPQATYYETSNSVTTGA